MILHVSKVLFLLRELFYKTHGYFLDRIRCCAQPFVRWVEDVFPSVINTNINIPCFHSFFVTFIYIFFIFICTQSLLLALIIIRTWIIFVFIFSIVIHMLYIYAFRLFLIRRVNFILNCFVDVFFFNKFQFYSLGA